MRLRHLLESDGDLFARYTKGYRLMDLPVMPPLSPMLAKAAKELPDPAKHEGGLLFEPKWDGFRCIVFRDGDEVELGSRNERPLTRYFPEVVEAASSSRCRSAASSTARSSSPIDGRLEFERLLERIHPADVPGPDAGREDARPRSSPSTCWRSATSRCSRRR